MNKIDTTTRSIPLEIGITPKEWCRIDDVMILKRTDVTDVDGIRCIQLLDAEFGIANKQAARAILNKAEEKKLISEAQFGNRKNKKANMQLINKILLMDLYRQKKQSGVIAMNDAYGCFDRINHTVAILVLMHFGLAFLPAKILFEVLQCTEHRTKTGFGISKPMYGISKPPLNGTGQGNLIGPIAWALISSIMNKVMEKRGHVVSMRSALSHSLISIVYFSFVDDTDTPIVGSTRNTTAEELQIPFQAALDSWAKLLTVTGGELCATKSWCYLIDFKWTGTKWVYKTKIKSKAITIC